MVKIGDIIENRYNVLSLLGEGGMAYVFECKDLFTKNTVALKILKEELLNEKGILEDFKKEVKTSINMFHQNIMEIYGEGVHQNCPFLVFEYLKDQTLLDRIEYYTKFTVKEACEIMLQLLDAVSYTHVHKIIHRDIKPQNIFYLPNGLIKLGDFGIAQNEKDKEIPGKIIGSVHFLAPEVLLGNPFSVASDIYASGVTFFQLVTGVLPFEGTTKEVSDKQIKSAFPNASFFNTSVPKEIDEIIFKAVEKNPKKRYKNADEFRRAISDFLEGKKHKRSLLERLF